MDARKAVGGFGNLTNKDRSEAVRSQREAPCPGRAMALAALMRTSRVCADSGKNFRSSPKCLTDLAPIARDKREHENLGRHRPSADHHRLRGLSGWRVDEGRGLSHCCPGPRDGGYRPMGSNTVRRAKAACEGIWQASPPAIPDDESIQTTNCEPLK
jgi:hypothetical protein